MINKTIISVFKIHRLKGPCARNKEACMQKGCNHVGLQPFCIVCYGGICYGFLLSSQAVFNYQRQMKVLH